MLLNRSTLLAVASLAAGCQGDPVFVGSVAPFDLSLPNLPSVNDLAPTSQPDLGCAQPNACGDCNSSCTVISAPPVLPLHSDGTNDPSECDNGVARSLDGIVLQSVPVPTNFLWIPNATDWNRGTVSKLDGKKIREVARYFTVTCGSLPTGDSTACDGTKGCCAADSNPQYVNRTNSTPPGPLQAVQINGGNFPSRTAVDFNGDVWIANRAFGGQSSVTKVASAIEGCVDRNNNQRIETSSDVDGDGVIETDCNLDGLPDDIATVAKKPCRNGKPQEFYGLDDECVLFTTNINVPNMVAEPLALVNGSSGGWSDAWVGTSTDGKLFKIDGATGITTKDVALADGCQPFGLAVDGKGYAWAAPLGTGPLCYFDTNTLSTGTTRTPDFGPLSGAGIAIDRDDNVWLAGGAQAVAYRYSPDRSNAFAKIGLGHFVQFSNPGGTIGVMEGNRSGIAVDSRTVGGYFAWLATDSGFVTRIDASTVPVPKSDTQIDASDFPTVQVAGSNAIGIGVDADQNLWSVSENGTVATRILVNSSGTMTAPDISSRPAGKNRCPAGDTCAYQDGVNSLGTAAYSDFTGFGLLPSYTVSNGRYDYLLRGCTAENAGTRWVSVGWVGDTAWPITDIKVKVRTCQTSVATDQTCAPWSNQILNGNSDLLGGVTPALGSDNFLQIEFDLSSTDHKRTPSLQTYDVIFECD